MDEVVKKKKHITYRCRKRGLKEDIPYNLINAVSSINKLYTNQVIYPNFKYLFSKNVIICNLFIFDLLCFT